MSHLYRLLLSIIAMAGLLIFVAYMAGMLTPQVKPDLAVLPATVPKETLIVSATVAVQTESVPASIEARETTQVATRLLAKLTELAVRPGDNVHQGQLIASLEKRDLQARLRQAEEQRRALAARLTESTLSLDRAESLRAKKLISEADYDKAQANVSALQAQLAAADQTVAEATTALEWSAIVSPIDGRVVERFVEPGDIVSPGQVIVSLYNPTTLRIEAWVRESLAVNLHLGQVLSVQVPAIDAELEAYLEEIVPSADSASRAFKVRLVMPQHNGLMPGMYARLSVPAGEIRALRIPVAYRREIGQLDVVWVLTEHGVERRFIRTGDVASGLIEVISGLNEGDVLVEPGGHNNRLSE